MLGESCKRQDKQCTHTHKLARADALTHTNPEGVLKIHPVIYLHSVAVSRPVLLQPSFLANSHTPVCGVIMCASVCVCARAHTSVCMLVHVSTRQTNSGISMHKQKTNTIPVWSPVFSEKRQKEVPALLRMIGQSEGLVRLH